MTECDGQIEQSLAKLPDRSAGAKLQPKVKKCHRKPNTVQFEATEPVFRAMGVDLTASRGSRPPLCTRLTFRLSAFEGIVYVAIT